MSGNQAAAGMCRQEIDEALRVGAITEVMTAFSRSKVVSKKEYVQTKVRVCCVFKPSWSSQGSSVRCACTTSAEGPQGRV